MLTSPLRTCGHAACNLLAIDVRLDVRLARDDL